MNNSQTNIRAPAKRKRDNDILTQSQVCSEGSEELGLSVVSDSNPDIVSALAHTAAETVSRCDNLTDAEKEARLAKRAKLAKKSSYYNKIRANRAKLVKEYLNNRESNCDSCSECKTKLNGSKAVCKTVKDAGGKAIVTHSAFTRYWAGFDDDVLIPIYEKFLEKNCIFLCKMCAATRQHGNVLNL